jgi:hypothetical protein
MPNLTVRLPDDIYETVVNTYLTRHGLTAEKETDKKKVVEAHLAARLVNEARDQLQTEAAEAARNSVPELKL